MKFLIVVLLLSSMVTGAFAQSNRQEKDRAAIDALVKSLKLLAAKDLSCADASDCEVISYGSRACGGSSGSVITSRNNANLEHVENLATDSAKKESVYNRNYGVVSICEFERPSTPTCVKKLCK